jgi:hypothetical protein
MWGLVNHEEIIREDILKARLTFRVLLEKYGLIELAGGQWDAISWLETQIIELADSVSRRERFLELVRQVKEGLERERERERLSLGKERQEGENQSDSEQKRRLNPYASRGFRKIRI